jgi:hypothetical protein
MEKFLADSLLICMKIYALLLVKTSRLCVLVKRGSAPFRRSLFITRDQRFTRYSLITFCKVEILLEEMDEEGKQFLEYLFKMKISKILTSGDLAHLP